VKFRSRPFTIEAFLWDGRNLTQLAEWAARADIESRIRRGDPPTGPDVTLPIDGVSLGSGRWRIEVHTVDGLKVASPGDWIMCGPNGEFYPCAADVFEATYEPADEQFAGIDSRGDA
jgi:hypothetical protein